MKTHLLNLALFGFLFQMPTFAQDITSVNATTTEISDNLDLRAVASIFGEAANLEDFERRLNDPKNQISNLDLNFDRQVDYLRVIEAVEKNTHLVILQAVLEKDVFQDVATIEVERDRNNKVQIQVVGDVYMYGPNYIYEPVYVSRPIIYNMFWARNYNPYCSPYYYNYYPTYYYAWTPYPIYRYRRNIHVHINQYNFYNYSNHRRSSNAVAMHEPRRSNGYEKNYAASNVGTRTPVSSGRNYGTRNENVGTRSTVTNSNKATDGTTGIRNYNSTTRSEVPNPRTSSDKTTGTRNYNSTTRSEVVSTRNSDSSLNNASANANYSSQSTRPSEIQNNRYIQNNGIRKSVENKNSSDSRKINSESQFNRQPSQINATSRESSTRNETRNSNFRENPIASKVGSRS